MCLCSEVQALSTNESTENANPINIDRLEELLSTVHDYVQSNKQLKIQLSFTLRRRPERPEKESSQRTAKIFQYNPDEYNTKTLLQNNIQIWNEDPALFWTQFQGRQQCISSNPQHFIVFACLQLEFSNAHSSILRRFYCIVLARLRATQSANDNAETIARSLYTALNSKSQSEHKLDTLIDAVECLIKAGSRYENIAGTLGIGSLFLLGQDIGRLVWEKWLPKTGDLFERAMSHLDHAGIVALGKTYEPLAEKVIHYLISRVFKPQVIDSVPQIQQRQKRGFASSNSTTELATKRLRQGGNPDNHNTTNDQGILGIPDQLGADNLNDQAPDFALGQFRQDVPPSLPAPSPSITVPEPTLTAHPATSHSNPISINTLLNMADCVAESTQGQQIADKLDSSLSQPSNGIPHGQVGAIGNPIPGDTNFSVVSQAKSAYQTEATGKKVAKTADVDKLEHLLGAHFLNGIYATRMRHLEKVNGWRKFTNAVRLHVPFIEGEDFALEVWLSASFGQSILQAMINSTKDLRNLLGDYIFEATKVSNWMVEAEKKGIQDFNGAIIVSFPDGDDSSDCKMEVMLNCIVGFNLLKSVFY
ncbi:hypothetical protein EAF04_004351 [Stromatinia cepivora]|nr:hypothetical protein EAF04_004351 [Stromatinia cepivora]